MTLGRDVVLEVLRTEGVTHLFGNPGTTELPLMDALAEADDLRYVLALQEATAVGMADGYAQVTGRPAFLNLHTSAGLGNAIGNLTNAVANRAPLVVTAGQQDYRHIATDPLLAGDLVGLASAVSKWAMEVRTTDEVAVMLRRAFKDAATQPQGPVFVSLPMNLLDLDTEAVVPPPTPVDRSSIAGGLEALATLLADTDPDRLAIVAGDEVGRAGALAAVVALAERLGCRVFGSPLYPNVVFPTAHPLWYGALAPMAAAMRNTLSRFDRVLLLGGQAFMVYPYSEGPALPPTVELLHLAPSEHDLGRVHAAGWAAAGDLSASVRALDRLVAGVVDGARAEASAKAIGEERTAARQQLEQAALDRYGDAPVQPIAAAHAVVRAIPTGAIVVDEAITTGGHVRSMHEVDRANRYLFCKGGGLGWGMPAAAGASLAAGEPVLCVVGDGSAMYSPQALWTAAHEGLPVVFVVVNNRQYLILKNSLRGRGGPSATTGRVIGMDIDDPAVDYVALATSMGVDGRRVGSAAEAGDAVRAAWDSGKPALVEIPIAAR